MSRAKPTIHKNFTVAANKKTAAPCSFLQRMGAAVFYNRSAQLSTAPVRSVSDTASIKATMRQ